MMKSKIGVHPLELIGYLLVLYFVWTVIKEVIQSEKERKNHNQYSDFYHLYEQYNAQKVGKLQIEGVTKFKVTTDMEEILVQCQYLNKRKSKFTFNELERNPL